MPEPPPPSVAILLKGYPRVSETFIARELLELQELGLRFVIVSLRHPTDRVRHDLHERITAPVAYLPEYLRQEPLRVLRALGAALPRRGFWRALLLWLRDLARDPTPNRVRRFGQALVLAAELPATVRQIHAHFIHTPGSVARYTGLLRGLPFSLSAHAKDVWTIPDWEKREKLQAAQWTVTCTAVNARHLEGLAPGAAVELLYHGVDTARFAPARQRAGPAGRLTSLSVARCVPKKGLETLLDALARLPAELDWRHVHIGSGPLRDALRAKAEQLGLGKRVSFAGAMPQLEVAELLRTADLFCLPVRVAADGDRDGLPNVLLEAMSSGLPVIATPVSAVPELVDHERNGLLVPPDDPAALAAAIERLLREPELRQRLGQAGRARVVAAFAAEATMARLARRFGLAARLPRAA